MTPCPDQCRLREAICIIAALLLAVPGLSVSQTAPTDTAPAARASQASPPSSTGAHAAGGQSAAHRAFIKAMAGFLSTHDRAKAQQEFVGVTRIDPRYAPAWFNLGVLAELDQHWDEAKRNFEAYLQLVASGTDANRAREQLKLVDDYANNTVDPAQIRQQEYDAAIQRSRSFLAVGLFREAIAEAGRAQALDQSRWEAYAVVSIAMRRQHRIHEAVHFQNLAAEHAPAERREQVFDALLQTDAVGSH